MDQPQLQQAWARKQAWELAKTWIQTVLFVAMMGTFGVLLMRFTRGWGYIPVAALFAATAIYSVVLAVQETLKWRAGRGAPPPSEASAVLAAERIDRNAVIQLIVANLPVVAGVAFLGWRMHEIVFLYWMDTVLAGAFTIPRLLRSGNSKAAVVFLLGYGMFSLMLVTFLGVFFPPAGVMGEGPRIPVIELIVDIVSQPGGFVAVLAMVAAHALAFRTYLRRGKFLVAEATDITHPAMLPLMGLMVFTVTGGFVVFHFGSTLAATALFVVVKILFDVHRQRTGRMAPQA